MVILVVPRAHGICQCLGVLVTVLVDLFANDLNLLFAPLFQSLLVHATESTLLVLLGHNLSLFLLLLHQSVHIAALFLLLLQDRFGNIVSFDYLTETIKLLRVNLTTRLTLINGHTLSRT